MTVLRHVAETDRLSKTKQALDFRYFFDLISTVLDDESSAKARSSAGLSIAAYESSMLGPRRWSSRPIKPE
jgi:uncharacterized protein YegL